MKKIPIQNKPKACKGTGKAKGYGCGEMSTNRQYGLSKVGCKCFFKWLSSTKEGAEVIRAYAIKGNKEVAKEKRRERIQEKKDVKEVKDLKPVLQGEVNLIARLIDVDKGCISCEYTWNSSRTRQAHGGHFHSVGANGNIRFNLFNIYKQCSICNNHKSANKLEYSKGLIKIYGQKHYDMVEALPLQYKEMHFTKTDLLYAIKEARRIIRDIKKGKDFTRKEVNFLLNLYK